MCECAAETLGRIGDSAAVKPLIAEIKNARDFVPRKPIQAVEEIAGVPLLLAEENLFTHLVSLTSNTAIADSALDVVRHLSARGASQLSVSDLRVLAGLGPLKYWVPWRSTR